MSPYKSMAQLRFMHARKPKVAKRWDKKYDVAEDLLEKLAKHKSRKEAK